MSIFHYFSSDKNRRVQFIFNSVSTPYSKIDFTGSNHYLKAITHLNSEINISNKSVLDIGTGTGDWAAMFLINGANPVHGIDFAEKMIKKGKVKNPNVIFDFGNAESLTNYADNSFDIVTASFVIHGVPQNVRAIIIAEMNRISRSYVILHDFIGYTPPFIRFLEFLEQSDYKRFKKNIKNELQDVFKSVKTIQVKEGTGLYICNNSFSS